MSKLIEKLKEFKKLVDLNVRYDWTIPSYCPVQFPTNLTTNFQRNVHLKINFKKLDPINNYWVIQQWGGIRTFRNTPANDELIKNFLIACDSGRNLQRSQFNKISSLSKVASFSDPLKFFIYDSRVIFSLNWLNLAYGSPKLWYSQPVGRNTKLNKYSLETILNLSGISVVTIPDEEAYLHYCDFILSHYEEIGYTDPWELEMLLFVIADGEVIKDINSHTAISMPKSVNWLIKNHSRISIKDTPEGLVVDGDVNLSNMGLTKIPYKFLKVFGHFDISGNCLATFENCPEIAGSFDCSDNPYLSDDGSGLPKKLTGKGDNVFQARNNRSLAISLTESKLWIHIRHILDYLKKETCHETFSGLNQDVLSNLKEKLKKEMGCKDFTFRVPELEGIL